MQLLLTLRETENLIFKRYLILGIHRLKIKKIQGNLSVRIDFPNEELIMFEEEFLLLFSSVAQFEIPEKECNLFLNHYRIPKGYLKLDKRVVRDKVDEMDIPFFAKSIDMSFYLSLRNGLVGLFDYTLESIHRDDCKQGFHYLISEFDNLSSFKKDFLKIILSSTDFPTLVIKMDRFVPECFYRIVWWGRMIKDNLLKTKENIDALRGSEISLWMKSFLNYESIDYTELLSVIPEEFEGEYEFIIGYYIAIVNYESVKSDTAFYDNLFSNYNFKSKSSVFCWAVFFHSVFNSEISHLYFINSLRSDIYEIEKISCRFENNVFVFPEREKKFFNSEIPRGVILAEYLSLSRNVKVSSVVEIDSSEALSKLSNNLCYKNLENVGVEIDCNINEQGSLNFCFSSNNDFKLGLSKNVDFEKLIFYIEQGSNVYKFLKLLRGIQVKPISKLISVKKKVLVGFMENSFDIPLMFKVYASLINSSKKRLFEKILVVFIVDLEQEKLHSLEFNNYVKQEHARLSNLFKQTVDLVIRNKRNPSLIEIRRNIRNVLAEYTIQEIEVIHENLDEERACWILNSGNDFWISRKNENLFSFKNVEREL